MSLVGIKNGISHVLNKDSQDKQHLLDTSNNQQGYNNLNDEERSIGSPSRSRKSQSDDEEEQIPITNFSSFISNVIGKADPRVMSDIVIGLSDGLTVPFALTAGLSSLGDTKLVITGGFAELISGAISMGLGGYLAAKSESDYYNSEVKAEKKKFYNNITEVNHEIEDILLDINENFSEETIISFIKDLKKEPTLMVDFLIRFGKGLEEPAENRQLTSALTIGGAYFLGGFVPLVPYFFVDTVDVGLFASITVMAFTLFWFGFVKAQISLGDQCSTYKKIEEAIQMVLVGGIAAGSAWFLVRIIG